MVFHASFRDTIRSTSETNFSRRPYAAHHLYNLKKTERGRKVNIKGRNDKKTNCVLRSRLAVGCRQKVAASRTDEDEQKLRSGGQGETNHTVTPTTPVSRMVLHTRSADDFTPVSAISPFRLEFHQKLFRSFVLVCISKLSGIS